MVLHNKEYRTIDMLNIPMKTSLLYSLIFAIKTIIDALLPTLQIFATSSFINSSIAVVNEQANISSIYISVAILMGIMIYNAVIGILMKFIDCKRRIIFRNKLIPDILQKHASLEYRHIESAKTADLINRVMFNERFDEQIWDMYIQILNVINLIIYVMGILLTLFTQVQWVAITMLIATVPLLYFATKAGKKSYEADKAMSRVDRKANYLSSVMKNRNAVEERNVYGYTEKLSIQYAKEYEYARKFRQKITIFNYIKMKLCGIFTTAYSTVAMLVLLKPVINGSMTIGMFMAVMGAVFGLAQRLSWGMNGLLEDLSRKREYLRDLTEFMQLEEQIDATARPSETMTFNVIEFCNVSFSYPDTNKLILDNVSFVIEKGRHYAFVGVNGAGKTTITKLITGLYKNYSGEILVDGRSLKEFTQSEIKGLSSVVYQDFAKYHMTLYDNIAIGDINKYDQQEKVEKAISTVGLYKVRDKLTRGLDTPLGKIMKNGVDLSGGEWQRVAMARAVMSSAPLIVFDEPTAALDPISESMIYRNFEHISRGVTTIFISHRLASTKLADVIYVLQEGKIVERGAHVDLISKKGIYCKMYDSQANWYKNDMSVDEVIWDD